LWFGLGHSLVRLETNSPVTVVATRSAAGSDVVRFNGDLHVGMSSGGMTLGRLVPDIRTGVPSLHPIPSEPGQVFELQVFRDPAAGGRSQLLAATGNGLFRIEGEVATPCCRITTPSGTPRIEHCNRGFIPTASILDT
jgi:hypothetical protein